MGRAIRQETGSDPNKREGEFMRSASIVACLLWSLSVAGHAEEVAEPFKVGTFEIDGAPTRRHRAARPVDRRARRRERARCRRTRPTRPCRCRTDMLELIERYEYGLKAPALRDRQRPRCGRPASTDNRPDYVHDVADVRTLPPIMYPGKILNAAVNFYSHVNETGTDEERPRRAAARREHAAYPTCS